MFSFRASFFLSLFYKIVNMLFKYFCSNLLIVFDSGETKKGKVDRKARPEVSRPETESLEER